MSSIDTEPQIYRLCRRTFQQCEFAFNFRRRFCHRIRRGVEFYSIRTDIARPRYLFNVRAAKQTDPNTRIFQRCDNRFQRVTIFTNIPNRMACYLTRYNRNESALSRFRAEYHINQVRSRIAFNVVFNSRCFLRIDFY